MSIYKITGDDYVLQEESEEEIYIVNPEVTEIRCDINCPWMQIDLFQMTDGVKYIHPYNFIVQGINKFRIISKGTGDVLVESGAFINDNGYGLCVLMDFLKDYNDNPAEAIEALKNGEYEEEL